MKTILNTGITDLHLARLLSHSDELVRSSTITTTRMSHEARKLVRLSAVCQVLLDSSRALIDEIDRSRSRGSD